jgi:uncharacterized protein YndB with AHSA1/START domain
MTTPDVPLRMELTFELPGTPEQVWAAIATADGNSSWFMPTDLEPHEGGTVVFHMGEDSSTGSVTGWDPPVRLEYAEPHWAGLSGHADADVTPLVSEFLVRANSGGTCTLRVVSSAFGTGADWENEFFAEMEKSWLPYFENLRVYLAHFPGERATRLLVEEVLAGTLDGVWAAMRDAVGTDEPGKPVEIRGLGGRLERLTDPPDAAALALVHLVDPLPGTLILHVWDKGNGEVSGNVHGYLFSEDAAAYVEREEPAWRAWLGTLASPAG